MDHGKVFPLAGKRVWVAGHCGMVGSALMRTLAGEGCELLAVTRDELDLRRRPDAEAWMMRRRPGAIIIAEAKEGCIFANQRHPMEFLCDNLMIEANTVEAACRAATAKLLLLGSPCI